MTQPKRGRGRPTVLTLTLQRGICAALQVGAYIEQAVIYAGITKETYYDWLKKGETEQPGQPHRDFSDAVTQAQAASELSDLMVIDRATKRDEWRAAAWRLERKFPRRWGQQNREEVEAEPPQKPPYRPQKPKKTQP
jgi:hypothetical protein